MSLQLSTKETMLLQDLKNHEELCISKYTKYASEAQCQQLQSLFQQLASIEREHLNTVNQLLNGQIPSMNQGQQSQGGMQGQGMQSQGMQGQSQGLQSNVGQQGMGQNYSQNDAELCNDMLSTEKYVSSTYNTAIFEFKDPNVRQVLNHIQKEEQEHGEKLFNYMNSHGMYNVK